MDTVECADSYGARTGGGDAGYIMHHVDFLKLFLSISGANLINNDYFCGKIVVKMKFIGYYWNFKQDTPAS